MTIVVTRQPLQSLPMSTSNRPPRRLSARLQEKDDAEASSLSNGYHRGQPSAKASSAQNSRQNGSKRGADLGAAIAKKRKIEYDEDVDGFAFTRGKRKTRTSNANSTKHVEAIPQVAPTQVKSGTQKIELRDDNAEAIPKRNTRKKMSFSTPNVLEEKPVRRSRRISGEEDERDGSPKRRKRKAADEGIRTTSAQPIPVPAQGLSSETSVEVPSHDARTEQEATKIALPFADTPIIRRNKAMREGRGSKGERRSSLGMRGRRASSLIDSGTSNALPHNEVEVVDFYKHIESEGLSEPRRMRQLLTWCATRAMGEKLTGKEFEDQSARLAARVIQEELLKDLSDRSELSDWFSREDVPAPSIPKVIKPNPKNLQNMAKIQELQEQIKRLVFPQTHHLCHTWMANTPNRLQSEKQSLESLTNKLPSLTPLPPPSSSASASEIDASLLSSTDLTLHQTLLSQPSTSTTLSTRLNALIASLGPTIDSFADSVHRVGVYRDAAERVADRALKACAQTLEERDRREGSGKPTTASGEDSMGEEKRTETVNPAAATGGGRESLGGVLRGLSRLES